MPRVRLANVSLVGVGDLNGSSWRDKLTRLLTQNEDPLLFSLVLVRKKKRPWRGSVRRSCVSSWASAAALMSISSQLHYPPLLSKPQTSPFLNLRSLTSSTRRFIPVRVFSSSNFFHHQCPKIRFLLFREMFAFGLYFVWWHFPEAGEGFASLSYSSWPRLTLYTSAWAWPPMRHELTRGSSRCGPKRPQALASNAVTNSNELRIISSLTQLGIFSPKSRLYKQVLWNPRLYLTCVYLTPIRNWEYFCNNLNSR